MEFSLYEILSGFAVTLYLLRCWLTKTFDYWRKRNVVGPKPTPLFGTFKDVALRRIHAADYVKSIYDAYPAEPAVGLFARSVPVLLMKDPIMIKDVLVKNFLTFRNRGLKIHEDLEPLAQHLMFLEYKRWKPLRTKLNPAFSSGKIEEIFHVMNDCAKQLVDHVDGLVVKDEPVECRELAARFTTDVIGTCAFGLRVTDENCEFQKIARQVTADTWTNKLRLLSRKLPHWMAIALKPVVRNERMINSFVDTVKRAIDFRKANDVRHDDFVDLLMDIQDNPEKIGHAKISDTFLTAQACAFVTAGLETTLTAMNNAMYELALNLDVQEKLRQEVNTAYEENKGEQLMYAAIRNMTYLEQVFKETLRKYPPAFCIVREASDDHMFEESKILISKGTKVIIPAYAIHGDSNIYPDPDKFDPSRFEEEAIQARPHMSFLAFGDGPRCCIGNEFARIQIKLGLASLIRSFKFEVCEETFRAYKKRHRSFLDAFKNGLYLKVMKIDG